MEWEGPEALEARNTAQATTSTAIKKAPSPEVPAQQPEAAESSGDGSADEYVVEDVKPRIKVRPNNLLDVITLVHTQRINTASPWTCCAQ